MLFRRYSESPSYVLLPKCGMTNFVPLAMQKKTKKKSSEKKRGKRSFFKKKFLVYKSEWSILYEHKELPALPLEREEKVVLTNNWIDWLPDLTSSF